MTKGNLILCATPIGNLEDITLRVLNALEAVDYIAAEDTRHTIKLLNHYGIKKPLISYHEHNKHRAGEKILDLVMEGKSVALVSDAGMPGISDPGADIVKQAWDMDITPTVLPGATAFVVALVMSGICTDRFVFEGFLPKKNKDRAERLQKLEREERTIIFYETPHRILNTLEELSHVFGKKRKAAVLRELTKIHEEAVRGTLEEIYQTFDKREIKGEMVIVVEGASSADTISAFDNISIEEHIAKYMEGGLMKKEAIKQVAKDRGIPKSEVYKHSLDLPLKYR